MWPDKLSLTGGAGGAGGPAGGTANNGLSLPLSSPFNFDSSGWVVNLGTRDTSTTAGGNTGANATKQAASAMPSSAGSGTSGNVPAGMAFDGGGLGSMSLGPNMMPLLLGAVGLFLVLSHKL